MNQIPVDLILFGGSFDPPHLGHLILAQELVGRFPTARVGWVPSFGSPLKQAHAATPMQRLEMVQLAITGNPSFEILRDEVVRGGPSFTFDTVQEILARRPKQRLALALGADQVMTMQRWHRWQELIAEVDLVPVIRPPTAMPELEEQLTALRQAGARRILPVLEMPQIGISSSLIRARVAVGSSIRYLVSDLVLRFIEEQGLYGGR